MVVFVWILMLEVVYMLMVTYRLTLRQLLGNAARLALGRLPVVCGNTRFDAPVAGGNADFVFILYGSIDISSDRRRIFLYGIWHSAEPIVVRFSFQRRMRTVHHPKIGAAR